MLKFFRRIRKQLLNENKLRSYIFYAIGEIILIVVGIIIAIQLNKWKENKKLDNIRHEYYLQLVDELDDNKNYINEIIQKFNQKIAQYDKLIQSLDSTNLTTEEILNKYSIANYYYYNILFQTGTIESLQSTGEIKLIPLPIRNKLLNLKRTMDRRIEVNKELNQEYKDRSRPAALLGGFPAGLDNKQAQLNSDILAHKKNSEVDIILSLDAALFIKNLNEKMTVDACNELLNEIEIIENLIHSELDK